jgi:transcriptional regulator with XRE-family HTH domain
MATFGERLKALRERAGVSQQALADAIGITRVQISRLETDESVPSWSTVQQLASYFDVSTEHFKETGGAKKPVEPEKPAPKKKKPGAGPG